MYIYLIILALYIIAEPIRNVYVIKGDSAKWHAWQFVTNLLFFISFYFLLDWKIVTLAGVVFWQVRDSIIGYSLTGNIWYLGVHGIDGWINQVFGSGKAFAFWFRIPLILILIYEILIS